MRRRSGDLLKIRPDKRAGTRNQGQKALEYAVPQVNRSQKGIGRRNEYKDRRKQCEQTEIGDGRRGPRSLVGEHRSESIQESLPGPPDGPFVPSCHHHTAGYSSRSPESCKYAFCMPCMPGLRVLRGFVEWQAGLSPRRGANARRKREGLHIYLPRFHHCSSARALCALRVFAVSSGSVSPQRRANREWDALVTLEC